MNAIMNDNSYGFFAQHVAKELDVTKSTLRRWSIELENNGYKFKKNEKRQRIYFERDYHALRKLKDLIQNDVTLADAINVVLSGENKDVSAPQTPSVHEEFSRSSPRSLEEYTQQIAAAAAEKAVAKAWNQIDKAIDEKLSDEVEKRDRLIVKEMNQALEQQRLQAAAETEQKKGFWSRLFGKGK